MSRIQVRVGAAGQEPNDYVATKRPQGRMMEECVPGSIECIDVVPLV